MKGVNANNVEKMLMMWFRQKKKILINLQFPSNAQLDVHSFMCYTIKFVAHFCFHFAYYQILSLCFEQAGFR